ncbi:uncharacterized protein LOC143072969 isoform X2 [Mytilus galloprovincialis]|uniref:uncharacterized protein LOC143072969 isoform X2 n=1 Tax=Mytilus galloprovincialis TaxID=29158 RepID=UPI003F7CD25C
MSSSTSTDAEEERRVKDIIDALKSKGLFDQFRKECLADVDTKPAYQNLRQRVEGYVSRFLSRQQWSPSLNKNQLRDNLRKQITASGMLANGVERVIEQVINPKILQLIKPKIDEVVCTHLGIDSKERKAQQEAQKQQQKETMQSLMSINLSQAEQNQTSTPSSFQGEQSTTPAAPTFSSPYSQAIWTQQMPPQVAFGGMMPNYPMVPPFGGFPPFGMPPQMFPYWNNFMFPQPIPGMPGIPFPPPMSSGATTTTVTSSQFAVSPIPPVPSTPTTTTQTTAVDTPTPPKSSQPPLPPTPPPPGTEDIPVVIPKEESKDKVTKALFSKQEEKGETYDIPLPPIARGAGKVKSKMDIVVENEDSNQSYEMDIEDDDEGSQDTKRPYKFAWDEVVDADQKSDITISSVHTSDLSSCDFDELGSGSDNDMFDSDKSASEDDEYIERPQASPLSVAGDKTPDISEDEVEDIESTEVPPNTNTDIEVPEEELKPTASTETEVPPTTHTDAEVYPVTSTDIEQETPASHPELSIPLPPTSDVATAVEVVSPSKHKKLISLQYNYSDSEDEETREVRKSRIAKEKEERYLKRAQRRAELEAKRREREEEKVRIREERKKIKEQKADESTDKAQTDSSERIERTDSLEESSPEKVPSSPEKKKRKTKAELKMELTKQKVMEKKAALRRQRTRNRRYTSDEFTSIFNEKKQPFSSQSYSEVVFEEPTIEETIVTDHIEYIVDESQNHPDFHTQEVCETMEGEVILEDGTQLKVEVFMEDMPSTPPTPTQDEPFTEVVTIDEDSSSAQVEDNSVSSTQGKSIDSSESARRATSPLSDVSDESLSEVTSKGTKRKRQGSESKSEREHKKSQRYDESDLYKPRPNISGSRRRNSSPGAAFEKDESQQQPRRKRQPSRKSETSRSSRHSSRSRSRSVESDCQPSPISSSSLASVHSRGSSYSRSGSSSSSSSEKSKSRSRSRSSGSSVDEFGRRKRRKGKMPIEMIDFGEAERMIEKNLYRVSFGEAEKRAASSMDVPIIPKPPKMTKYESMDVPSIAKPPKMTKYDRRFKARGRGATMTRGTWQRQNSWQFPEGANSGSWSPQGSPTKRYYFPEPGRSPSPQSPVREVSPGMWDDRSESPPYYPGTRGRRSSSQLLEDSPPRRSQFAMGRRPQSPPPEYLRRSLSPSEHMMAPEPWGREPSMSPPRIRGHRSPSPPYPGGRLTPSPPPYIPRGQRSPSPGRPYLRGRSPSPYRPGMRRTPSPPLSRGAHSPSPPFYRGSPPHRPVTRGRSPSPSFHRRSPSPHRPMTRGQTAIPPHDLRKKPVVNSPKVPMTNKLRNIKFGSPFQQMGPRRGGRSSPPSERPPSKRGRR